MKTISQVKIEQDALFLQMIEASQEGNEKYYKKLQNEYQWFGKVILYLETEPSKEFIVKEIQKIEQIFDSCEKAIKKELSHQKYVKMALKVKNEKKSEIRKIFNVSKLTKQIQTLKYILNG